MKVFTITDEMEKEIEAWQEWHIAEKHIVLPFGGAIGGRFSYEFCPTGIGTVGTCVCSCGEKFVFDEI